VTGAGSLGRPMGARRVVRKRLGVLDVLALLLALANCASRMESLLQRGAGGTAGREDGLTLAWLPDGSWMRGGGTSWMDGAKPPHGRRDRWT